MDFSDLGLIADAARKCQPPIRVSLQPYGLLFETSLPPFLLKHLLSYEKMREYPQHAAKTIMDKMQEEIAGAVRDAKEAATANDT